MNAVRLARDDVPRGVLPVLSTEEEAALCRRWHDHHDLAAAERLTGSHLHMVARIAKTHPDRGVPAPDLIGEGCWGLMRVICRYDPACGTRFTTYATWWVEFAIQSVLQAAHATPAIPTGSVVAIPPPHSRDWKRRAPIHIAS